MVATGYAGASHEHDDEYAALAHAHAQGDVTGLSAALAGKSDTSHNHDGEYAEPAHAHLGAYAPALQVAPEPGTRWYLTDDPFDAALLAQLVTGDRFTYPLGHASERETYRWDGDSWEFHSLLPAMPAAADAVTYGAAPTRTFLNATLGTGVTQRANTGTPGSCLEPGDLVRLRGAIDISGNPASGTVLLTLNAAHAPVGGGIVHPGIRTGPTGNVSAVLLINTSGQVTLTAAPGTGAYLGLDGITFVRTVA